MMALRMTEEQYLALQNKPKAKATKAPSQIEELLAMHIKQAELPTPVREYQHIPGRRFRIDFAWPDRKLGVEVQGNVHRIKERFEADIIKRALGQMAGWRILEVSGRTIREGHAIQWVRELLK